MSLRSIQGGLTANHEYVCLSCRLQSRLSQARRNLRYQHTSTQSTDTNPGIPDRDCQVAPLAPNDSTKRQIGSDKKYEATKATLPVRKAGTLPDTLQQKFLEKRRLEGLAFNVAKAVEDSELSVLKKSAAKEVIAKAKNVSEAKKSKKKSVVKLRGALKSKKRAKEAATEAPIASDAEKLEKETKRSKQKAKKAKKDKKPSSPAPSNVPKPKRSSRKASAIQKPSEPKLTESVKSGVSDLEKALASKTKAERKPKLTRASSRLSKDVKPSTVSDASKTTRSARKVGRLRLRRVGYVAPEKANSSKNQTTDPKFGEEDALHPKDLGDTTQIRKAKIENLNAEDLRLQPLDVNQLPVPTLAYGLDRVLFNPGIYHLQDPRSKVFNFDPYLQKIMPVTEFDFDALKEYITSSKDQSLKQLAGAYDKRYVGSTSSMSGALTHFHFLLSQWRHINTKMLSKTFPDKLLSFTELQRCPSAIFLRWQDGSYAIDADKQFDSANILMMLGKSMEKLLTLDTEEFERYRKSNLEKVTEEERNAPESFHYTTMGDFLMRSQLDAFDARLPGTGMFDLKTRAVVSIRMEPTNHEQGIGYQIKTAQGEWESFEREYYDMIRAAFLKYSLQVRMGRMDGIFVAYHNTDRIFGFQYISQEEMDLTLHGQWDTSIGDQEFKLSLELLNKILDKATKKYPEKSLRIHFETREVQTPFMYIFAEPVTDDQIQEIQTQNNEEVEAFQRKLLGLDDGNSEPGPAPQEDGKWADIQADVQEEMVRDEMSIADRSRDEEWSHTAAHELSPKLERSKVLEDGPLYRNKSLDKADEDGVVATTASEESEKVVGEDSEQGDTDILVDGKEETSKEADDLAELQAKEQIHLNVDDATETTFGEVTGYGDVGESTDNKHKFSERDSGVEEVFDDEIGLENDGHQSDPRESLENMAELEGSTQVDVQEEELESLAGDEEPEASVALDYDQADLAKDSSHQDGIQQDIQEQTTSLDNGFDTRADRPFLKELDQEHNPTSGSEVLAMALTIRNKVNGSYVQRPENIGPDDKWSVEYSLEEVAKPERAWSLYLACQTRRRRKLEGWAEKQEEKRVDPYLQKLRELSRKGALWREETDRRNEGRKVAVVGQPVPSQEEETRPAEQQSEQ